MDTTIPASQTGGPQLVPQHSDRWRKSNQITDETPEETLQQYSARIDGESCPLLNASSIIRALFRMDKTPSISVL